MEWLSLCSGHFQRKNIFDFEIAERLRTLRYLIFTGGVFAYFPTKSALWGAAKQCIVQKMKFASCKTAANALFYSYSLPL